MINHTHSISAPSPQPAGSPTKQKSSTQPKRQAPPPPSSSSSSLTKGLVKSNPRRPSDGSAFELHKRENKSKISKDQRYSVQVSPGNAWEYDAQFDSLPRRPPPHHFNEGGNPPSQDQQYYSLQRPSNKVKTSSPKSPQKQHSPLRRRSGSSSSGSPKSPQKSIRNLSVQGSPPQRVLSVPATQTTPPQSTPGGKEKGASSLPQTTPPSQPSKRPSAVAPPPQLTLPTSFTSKDGHELVEIVRTRTGSSHKKAQLAVAGVLQLIKDKVPQCEPMVDAFFVALEQARVSMTSLGGVSRVCVCDGVVSYCRGRVQRPLHLGSMQTWTDFKRSSLRSLSVRMIPSREVGQWQMTRRQYQTCWRRCCRYW